MNQLLGLFIYSFTFQCGDDGDLPDINYDFRQIKDIEQINKDALVGKCLNS